MKLVSKLLIALALSSVVLTARAQANVPAVPNLLTNQDTLTQVYTALETSGIFSSTNYSVDPYLTYAPKAPKGDKVGGGILAIYNVNNYVGAALGLDYLGQFRLVSGNATLKLPVKLSNYISASWATNITVTPFVLAGVGADSGTSGSGLAIIADAGGAIEFGHLWGGQFNVGASYGTWIDAGPYSGPRFHIFAGWSHGF
jgi:hypothetical protein